MTQIASLSSSNWRERKQAIEALARSGDASLAQTLLELLHQSRHNLGELNAALQLLCRLDVAVTPGLIQLLGDSDPGSRIVAALALGELKAEEAVPDLLQALNDSDTNVRFHAIEALGKIGARQAVEPLVAILRQRDFFLAFPAIEALAAIGDPRPVPVLIESLNHEMLSEAAVLALGRLGDPARVANPIAAWLEGPVGNVETAVLALTDLGFRNGLGRFQKAAREVEGGRQEILGRIAGSIGPSGRAKILEAAEAEDILGVGTASAGFSFEDANPDQPGMEIQERSNLFLTRLACLLGWLLEVGPQDEPVQAAVLRLLHPPASRELAAEALARVGRSATQGLNTLLDDPDPEVRYTAARALAATADPAAGPVLIAALEAEDSMLVALAAQALGKSGNQEAFEPLLRQLAHPSAAVRQAAAIALSQLDSPQRVPRLFALVQAADPALRESALRSLALSSSLEASGDQLSSVLAALEDASPAVRKAAVEVLPLFDAAPALNALAQTLQDPDPALRAAAARALARTDPDFSRPLLSQAVQDPDPWTRLYACRSLAQVGGAEILPVLSTLLSDPLPPVRIALAQALGQAGGPQAAELLKILSFDSEEGVRQAAEIALAGLA